MTVKAEALQIINSLPDDVTWEDVRERLAFITGIQEAIRELDEGKGIPHTEVRKEYAQWLTD
jgi:hypothetical protein